MQIQDFISNYWLIGLIVALFIIICCITVVVAWKMGRMWFNNWQQRPITLKVESRENITDRLFTVNLSHPNFKILPSFSPGQYVSLEIPVSDSQTIRRAYSIANWDKHPKQYHLGIKREELGKGSNWLYNHLKNGCIITVNRPKGDFYLPQNVSGCLVFVANGIGITPFRAMVQAIANSYLETQQCKVFLFHSCRYPEQLCYHQEFSDVQKHHPNFRYIPVITGDVTDWTGRRGRIGLAIIQQFISDLRKATYYLCAGIEMMDKLTSELMDNGVAASQIITESYGVKGLSQTDKHFMVTYHNQIFDFDNQTTLFQAIEDVALPIDGDCRSGSCGMCKCKLVNGRVTYLLKPQHPLKNNEILPCCCIPETDLVLQ